MIAAGLVRAGKDMDGVSRDVRKLWPEGVKLDLDYEENEAGA